MHEKSLLPAVEVGPGVGVRASVIWLHGLGADGHDFEPVAAQLSLPPGLGIRFLFPHAPSRPVTINNGMVMRAWYDVRALDISQGEDAEGICRSSSEVLTLVEAERRRGIAGQRIILAGFSQGGAIAVHAALRAKIRLAGVIMLSSYLPLPDSLEAEAEKCNADIPIFMAHGTEDTVIPHGLAESSRRRLEALGYRLEFRSYGMAHAVCAEELQDIRAWLLNLLS